jgi:hypothetical protein
MQMRAAGAARCPGDGPCSTPWGTWRRRLLGAALICAAALGSQRAEAQQAIVGPEDAVVTGFSGAVEGQAPEGSDPLDYLVIPPDSPAARVVDLSRLGAQGALSDAPKPFTLTAGQIGQVFGVALDDAPAPSIYLAATSAYGLSIGLADASGGPVKRLLHGLAGAAFIPNQFGPADLNGGPGSVWRVDGTTGQVSLFAKVGDEGVNAAAALGGLAFDSRSQQIYVADRATGMIHRFALDGTERGVYDHGVAGREQAGLASIPWQAVNIAITSAAFDTEQPATWGFADPERLVFGLAVHGNRLYYAVAAGPEIWSVGIQADGGFAADSRFEVAVETLQPGIEIASIAFDNRGLLYAAERAPPTGAYDLRNVAEGGSSRVLRFRPKARPDSQPGLWMPVPDDYAIGLAPEYQNANGGVALGRGYDGNGRMLPNACAVTLWSTGEQLLGNAPSSEPVDGLQGNDTQLVVPANAPPNSSWFVDYDDQPGDSAISGHMGAVATLPCVAPRRAAAPPPPPPPPRFSEPLPPPPPVMIGCPVGTFLVGDTCLLPPSCPPGTRFRDGYCLAIGCPPDMIRINGACLPPPIICNRYETFANGRCIPWRCPPDMVRLPNGYCGCPRNEIFVRGQCIPPRCPPDMFMTPDGRCMPPQWCRPPMVRDARGRCVPPLDCRPPMTLDRYGRCVPPQGCRPPMVRDDNGRCVPPQGCRPPMVRDNNGRCVPPQGCRPPMVRDDNGRCVPPQGCRPPMVRDDNGRCVPPQGECRPPMVRDNNGRCVPPQGQCRPPMTRDNNGRCVCPEGQSMRNGRCLPPVVIDCQPGWTLREGRCVPPRPCPRGQVRNDDGRCMPIAAQPCGEGQVRQNGRCVAAPPPVGPRPGPTECRRGQRLVDGVCVDARRPQPQTCPEGSTLRRGRCVPEQATQPDRPTRPAPVQCGADQRLRNGRCVDIPPQRQPPPKRDAQPKAPDCAEGTVLRRGRCVPAQANQPDRQTRPAPVECGPDQRLRNGRCVDAQPQRRPAPDRQQQPDRQPQSKPQRKAPDCPDGTVLRRGQCVKLQQQDDQSKQRLPNRMREQMEKLQQPQAE